MDFTPMERLEHLLLWIARAATGKPDDELAPWLNDFNRDFHP